jgi:pyruvate dehydrogenase E1 component
MNDASIHRHLQTLLVDDRDPEETAEWRDAIASVLRTSGPGRVRELMDMLSAIARDPTVGWQPVRATPYVNTIHVTQQPMFPGDLAIE